MRAPRTPEGLITPHGGALVDRHPDPITRAALLDALRAAPSVALTPREAADLALIACGALSPLEGFLGPDDYEAVLRDMHLRDNTPWTLPVVLSATDDEAAALREGDLIALRDADGLLAGAMTLQAAWRPDKAREALLTLGTSSDQHPGVRYLRDEAGPVYLSGPTWGLRDAPPMDPTAAPWWRTPAQTRADFARRQWRDVVAFQTRNPMHRAHEHLTRCALELVDGLLIHPLVGPTRDEDLPTPARMRCYQVLLDNYYNPAHAALAVNPAAMRYAGPREAIFHAIVRRNHGCSHLIVGRDHAGVGGFYGPWDAQRLFERFDPVALGVTPLCFGDAFYCVELGGMATEKTSPPGATRISLSGTRVRELLAAGQAPPPEVMRPEVARVLMGG